MSAMAFARCLALTTLIASASKEAVIYLLDADSLGGKDHQTSLYSSAKLGNDEDQCCAGLGTGLGIGVGIIVMVIAIGPAVFFLFFRRYKQAYSRDRGRVDV